MPMCFFANAKMTVFYIFSLLSINFLSVNCKFDTYYKKIPATKSSYSVLNGVRSSISCATACTRELEKCVAFYYNSTGLCELLDSFQENAGQEEIWVSQSGKFRIQIF